MSRSFLKKTADYGTAWRILRPASITDQLYIKALRIRSIEEKGKQEVTDPIESEFIGLVNYSILAMIQINLPSDAPMEFSVEQVERMFDEQVAENIRLLQAKNHDYDEAWRLMRISSMTDLILQNYCALNKLKIMLEQPLFPKAWKAITAI